MTLILRMGADQRRSPESPTLFAVRAIDMSVVTPPETTDIHRRRLRMILVGIGVTVTLMVAAVLLIEHGWRLRVNSNGIEIAAIHYPEDIPLHIARGADVNASPWLLQFAVNFQNSESVRVLLANGPTRIYRRALCSIWPRRTSVSRAGARF